MKLDYEAGVDSELHSGATSALQLSLGNLPSEDFLVLSVDGVEEISQVYRFDVMFRTSLDAVELKGLVPGCDATLTFWTPDAPARVIRGFSWQLTELGADTASPEKSYYRVRIVPHVYKLRKRRNSRIFQNTTVVDVVTKVLNEHGIAHRWALHLRYRQTEYCVQYQETDYEFITRLLSQVGIFFFFEPSWQMVDDVSASMLHRPSGHRERAANENDWMVMGDSILSYLPMAEFELEKQRWGEGHTSPLVAYRDPTGVSIDHDRTCTEWTLTREVKSKSVTLTDYHFKTPLASLVARAAHGEGNTRTNAALETRYSVAPSPSEMQDRVELRARGDLELMEVYSHHGEFEEPDAFGSEAILLLQALRARALVARGKTQCRRMSPGFRFWLDEHPLAWLDREYLVLRVEHHARASELPNARESQAPYTNRVECIPANTPFRPKKRARKMQQVLEVATVVGPAGEEIYTDEYGRVRVEFPWDRDGQHDANSSCWLRVTQSWAGAGWGHQFLPRIGMEVLVGFLGGDTDRPIVLGTSYNGLNPPPFALPEAKTRSGIRSQSTPGGGGYNEIAFEDAHGEEVLAFRAERDLETLVRHDNKLQVQHDLTETVEHDATRTVHGNETHTVHKKSEQIYKTLRSISVTGTSRSLVEGTEDRTTVGTFQQTVKGRSKVVCQGYSETVCTTDRLLRVKGCQTTVIGTRAAPMHWAVEVAGTVEQHSTQLTEIRSDTEILLRCGDSSLLLTPTNIEISASRIQFASGQTHVIVEKDRVEVVGKSSVMVRSEGTTEVRGQSVKLGSNSGSSEESKPKKPTTISLRDQNGKAIPNQRYRLQRPDGSVRVGVLDDNGNAELGPDEQGDVTFPDCSEVM